MRPCLVGGAGLFATCGAVAIDQFGWGVRGGVADVVAGAASGCHCKYVKDVRRVFIGMFEHGKNGKKTKTLCLSTPQSIP